MKFKELPSKQTTENGGRKFVKLSDKESIKGVFRGDPYDYRQHWLGSFSAECMGENCPECAKKIKASFRFRINFITKEGDTYVAKVIEQGRKFYDQLRSLHEGGYNLEKTVVQITRMGKGQQDTTYTIVPIQNGAVTPALDKTLSAVPLNELANLAPEGETKAPSEDWGDANEDIPF